MTGLLSYGAYVPFYRLDRAQIGAVLGTGGGKGTRAVASFDEDASSMGVEAARRALRAAPDGVAPGRLLFATANPPYLDKTNANVVHAALDLDAEVLAIDVVGSTRSAAGGLVLGAESATPTLVVTSDVRTGLPGGADERDGGDAAAAFLFGDAADPIAEVLAQASVTEEFLDRWRLPGAPASRVWEERFGEHVYVPLAQAAFENALKNAGLSASDVDVLVVAGTHARACKAFAGRAGVAKVADDLSRSVGNAGAAQPGLLLAAALDDAAPGTTIALVVLADGATALILRTTPALAHRRGTPTVAEQIAAGNPKLPYARFLSWRGQLSMEPPRRPDPVGPAAPPSARTGGYKYGFVGSRCTAVGPDGEPCGTVHLPPVRVCVNCKSVDQMEPVSMSESKGAVVTYTIDHLAFSPSPPVLAAVVDFDGGGRFSCELTDVDPSTVAIGDRVEMTFRRTVTAGGIHNYFWKARPVAAGASQHEEG